MTFWPRIGLLGARLRNLYKRKLLGGFLEAQNRKSAFWTRKVGNFAPKPGFRGKSVFRATIPFARKGGKLPKRYLFGFKKLLRSIASANSGGYWPQNCRIGWNLLNFRKFLEIWWNSRKFTEFQLFCVKRDPGRNDQKYYWNTFIIAVFWSVGEKRSPFSRKWWNFLQFKCHKVLCTAVALNKFPEWEGVG